MSDVQTHLMIEMETSDGWTGTGHGPMPHRAEDVQQLSEEIWIAYVNYMNVREMDTPYDRKKFRLVRWHIKREKVIVHV